MRVGTFLPEQANSVLYAMAGDDCSLHHDLDQLTPKQRLDHQENQVLTCALQVALTGLGKPNDYVALGDPFLAEHWADNLRHYQHMFREMGLPAVPPERWQFYPLDTYYSGISAALPPVDMVNLYMISGSNLPLHGDMPSLAISRNVNSKLHFAKHAPKAGIPVPRTEIYRQSEIKEGLAEPLFAAAEHGVMVKLLGLAGSRNVFAVATVAECLEQVAEYSEDMEILLQERLDTSRWREMTVDLKITPDAIEISNVRQILFAGGKWVGNFLSPELTVPDAHRDVLIAVGEYARHHGHVAPEGVNCGIDYFISGDDVIVTEINARWTGGLFPAEFLRRLSVSRPAIAFFDMVSCADLDAVHDFQGQYLYPGGGAFSYIPMGFTPFAMEIEGVERYFIWQIVEGDFAAFVQAKSTELGDSAFPTANSILEEALS